MTKCDIIVLGDLVVGKTAMIIRFVLGEFQNVTEPTIEDSYTRTIAIDNENVQLDIVDLSGQDDYEPLRTAYMTRLQGFVIVYGIDNRASFEKVAVLHSDLLRARENDRHVPVVICGNKCDLADKRVVSKAEGKKLAKRLHAKFFETSALSNVCIEDAFRALARDIRKSTARSRGHKGCAPS